MRLVRSQAALAISLLLGAATPVAYSAPKHKTAAGGGAVVGDGGFDLTKLPKGKDVTIPRPATTFVPLTDRVTFTATDLPQILSFRGINRAHGPVGSLRLAIFDAESDRVRYVDLAPGTSFLYEFKSLGSIAIVSEASGGRAGAGTSLQVESNKPLGIAH